MANNSSSNVVENDTPSSFLGLGSWPLDTRLFRVKIDHWIPSSLINAWPWRNKESRHRFDTLPLEVLTEILKHVHWHDLLIVRQVCKRLNDVSRTRAVWTKQYRSYLAEKRFRLPAEEPIDLYSPVELESWVLQRRSADQEWKSNNHPVRERTISLDDDRYTLTLVPGGRWLLATILDGSVLCYDLEDPEMRSIVLTPPRVDANDQLAYNVAIDIDRSTSALKFFMVNYPSDYFTRPLIGSLDLMIWCVKLRGHGSSARLEAHLLHTFPATEPFTSVLSVSLYGNLLARLVYTSQFRAYIEIFDWRSSTASVHRRTVIFPRDAHSKDPVSVLLLPGGRLVFVSLYNLFVYDFGTMVDDQPVPPIIPHDPSEPQWTLPKHDEDYRFRCHQSSLDSEALTLVLTSKQMIYRLVIPHNVEHLPHLACSTTMPQKYRLNTAGREKALMKKQDSILVIGMAKDLESNTTGGRELVFSPLLKTLLRTRSFPPPTFAEDIGRIIIEMNYKVFILDISRFPIA